MKSFVKSTAVYFGGSIGHQGWTKKLKKQNKKQLVVKICVLSFARKGFKFVGPSVLYACTATCISLNLHCFKGVVSHT